MAPKARGRPTNGASCFPPRNVSLCSTRFSPPPLQRFGIKFWPPEGLSDTILDAGRWCWLANGPGVGKDTGRRSPGCADRSRAGRSENKTLPCHDIDGALERICQCGLQPTCRRTVGLLVRPSSSITPQIAGSAEGGGRSYILAAISRRAPPARTLRENLYVRLAVLGVLALAS